MAVDDGETLRAVDPGQDLHEWQSTRASLEEEAESSPDAVLSELAELVERMLVTRGYDVADPVARAGDERDVVVTYLAARETAERAELGEASRGDVEAALDDLRSVFDTIAAG
ncbi:MAG TPA: hypothetical protein VFB57_05565 [Gaiellaceae bacterium]|jgi:hypothetical protein|nr:hypothetical protein [Gaiellaceae bacterium]